MEEVYKNARYIIDRFGNKIICVDILGEYSFVPVSEDNLDYRNIMELVEQGKLVIQEPEVKE